MYFLKLLLKNPFRHKLRSSLTVLGITIAILSFGMLRTIIGAWYSGVDASSASRLVTRNAISIIFTLPMSYKEKIRQVEGVKIVSWGNWFGGYYIDKKNFFANFAVDPKSYLNLYPEFVVPEDQKNAFIRDRKGAVVGKKLMERFHWKLGDTVTLKGTIYPGDWSMTIRGVYTGKTSSTDETQLFFQWDYLNESMRKSAPARADQVGFYMIGVKSPGDASPAAQEIDSMFKNSLAETLTESEKAFQLSFIAMTEAIVIAIKLVSYVVIIIIMAVTANTMAMTARERIGEYAVFKTLGFGGIHISILIFGESMFIAMLGGIIAVGLDYPAALWFKSQLSNFFPIFNIDRNTIYMQLAAAFVVGFVAALFPAWRAVRIKIADGLRRIG
ncbi:MAG TPA: FtsX-like permease family protein [Nitrospirota bacterium]